MPFCFGERSEARIVKAKNSIQYFWTRKGTTDVEAAEPQIAKRQTLALPSILTPYRTSSNALPKPTPVNLRRFAETPLVRRAINVLKDRIASLDWQGRGKRGFSNRDVVGGQGRGGGL